MFKRQARSKLLDRLHKGVVVTCIGMTVYGCYLLGWRYYRYFAVVKPEIKRREAEDAKVSAIEGSSGGNTGFRDLAPELKT